MIATAAAIAGELTVADVIASLLMAESEEEIQRCVGAIISARLVHAKVTDRAGHPITLSSLVAATRTGLRVHEKRLADLQQTAAYAHGGDVELAYLHTFPIA